MDDRNRPGGHVTLVALATWSLVDKCSSVIGKGCCIGPMRSAPCVSEAVGHCLLAVQL